MFLLINSVAMTFSFHVLPLLLLANNSIDGSATLTTAVIDPHSCIFFLNVATYLFSRVVESELNTAAHLGTAGITICPCQVEPHLH